MNIYIFMAGLLLIADLTVAAGCMLMLSALFADKP